MVSFAGFLLDLLILCASIANVGLFYQTCIAQKHKGRKIIIKPITDEKKRNLTFRVAREEGKPHLPPPPPEINFSESELHEAILGMNLPTWSRSYISCKDPLSEVTCSQVVRAWRCLNGWSKYIETTPHEQRKHFITKHGISNGVCNRFSTDTATFLIALMLNRSYILDSIFPKGYKFFRGEAFQMHKNVELCDGCVDSFIKNESINIGNIQVFEKWYEYDYKAENEKKVLYNDILVYATMAYTHGQLSSFVRENFGLHAAYFASNYLFQIPNESIKISKKSYENVPANVRVFGVHLRLHSPGHYFSYGVAETLEVVVPFLKKKLAEMPTVFAFASDSPQMEQEFRKLFEDKMITCATIRVADYDHASALNDVALLEMADELLGTYRSTFSYVCASRSQKRIWYVERESPGVFQVSNSQSASISALFHNKDVNDWQFNRRVHINENNEDALRYYCKYLLI